MSEQGWNDPFPGRPYGHQEKGGYCPFCNDSGTVFAHGDNHLCDSCDTLFDDNDNEVQEEDDQ